MNNKLAFRLRAEIVLCLLTGALAILTAGWPYWIEAAFHADPDAGDGAVEWGIVGVLLLVSIVLAWSARRDWQRVSAAEVGILR